ncbi:MAG: hypothetical protein LBC98_02400 [Prevotellaceae bacterium]|jgi:hypothetical protein|nr:hypothetical protein [Prevotellaceae bacterium]
MSIKRNVTIVLFVLFSISANAQTSIVYESGRFEQILAQAKTATKPVMIEIQTTESVHTEWAYDRSDFINFKTTPFDRDYEIIMRRYDLQGPQQFIFVNGEGQLLAPIQNVASENELKKLVEQALKYKNDPKPLPQQDFDYRHGYMDKHAIFDYIAKRTVVELDNADIIDNYAAGIAAAELLKISTLSILFEKNTMNIPGNFYAFINENADKVKKTLKINNDEYNRIIEKSTEKCFEKLCLAHDEAAIEKLIATKTACLNNQMSVIVKNEYYSKFYYKTRQPLKLANCASAFADAIINHKDTENLQERNRALYLSTTNSGEALDKEACSLKLRTAAQYVVETLSSKTMLNNALVWSLKAIELFNCSVNYETHAYVLYKLGKRREAIDSMAKAYAMISHKNIREMESMGIKLIKMKRGEKIF